VRDSNVVLRGGEEGVLVDFGLAGKHIRPGCATGPNGAPEVWGELDGISSAAPAKADVYAFGCVAFEALTGRVLFDAATEMAQIAMHVTHDGMPNPLRELSRRPDVAPMVELLCSTLRRDPRDRPEAAVIRKQLARIGPGLAKADWPLAP
jgi:serine/threonine protein kinase